MGKILTLGDSAAVPIIGQTDKTIFSAELVNGKEIDFKYNGDPAVIIQMLYDVMSTYEHVAGTLITTVLIFADQKKIALEQLKAHSFIQNNKIVTP